MEPLKALIIHSAAACFFLTFNQIMGVPECPKEKLQIVLLANRSQELKPIFYSRLVPVVEYILNTVNVDFPGSTIGLVTYGMSSCYRLEQALTSNAKDFSKVSVTDLDGDSGHLKNAQHAVLKLTNDNSVGWAPINDLNTIKIIIVISTADMSLSGVECKGASGSADELWKVLKEKNLMLSLTKAMHSPGDLFTGWVEQLQKNNIQFFTGQFDGDTKEHLEKVLAETVPPSACSLYKLIFKPTGRSASQEFCKMIDRHGTVVTLGHTDKKGDCKGIGAGIGAGLLNLLGIGGSVAVGGICAGVEANFNILGQPINIGAGFNLNEWLKQWRAGGGKKGDKRTLYTGSTLQVVFVVDRSKEFRHFYKKDKEAKKLAKHLSESYPGAEFALTSFLDYHYERPTPFKDGAEKTHPHKLDPVEYCYKVEQKFTQSAEDFGKSVEKVGWGEGGDDDSSALSAMFLTMSDKTLGWYKGNKNKFGKPVERVIVLLTNTYTHTSPDNYRFFAHSQRIEPKGDGTDTCTNSRIPTNVNFVEKLKETGTHLLVHVFKRVDLWSKWQKFFKDQLKFKDSEKHLVNHNGDHGGIPKVIAEHIEEHIRKEISCEDVENMELEDPWPYNILGL